MHSNLNASNLNPTVVLKDILNMKEYNQLASPSKPGFNASGSSDSNCSKQSFWSKESANKLDRKGKITAFTEKRESRKICQSNKNVYPIFSIMKNVTNQSPVRKSSKILENFKPNNEKSQFFSPRKSKLKKSSSPKNETSKQFIIDAGQKNFGPMHCDVCGMIYSASDPEDKDMHKFHHSKFLSSVSFPGWKKERIVANFMNGRILKVLPSDPKFAIKKVEEMTKLIDTELGYNRNTSNDCSKTKVTYLYVSDDSNQVIGCLISEPISLAYRFVTPTSAPHSPMQCETQGVNASCGVSRIWTLGRFRRRGIASRLCDALRRSFVLGTELERDQIAFSHPSSSGRDFAAKYCQTPQFLTYNMLQQP